MEPAVASPHIYRFGLFEVDAASNTLMRKGLRVKIQEQPFRVLLLLLERPGEIVTREELRQKLWPEGTFVDFDGSLNVTLRKLRSAIDDDPDNPRFIETVPRHGYRFIANVERVDLTAPAERPPATVSRRTTNRWMLGAILGCVLLSGLVLLRWRITGNSARPAKTMLVVLPMQNLTGDEHQEYVADGITEEIITQLGNLDPRHLGVIARTSAMQYKHAAKGTAQISRELGVNYLLEGSIQRSAERIRVTAQLIQASDQTHLWAQTYDRKLSDVLKVESDVASVLAGQIRLTLSEQTNQRLASVARVNPEAHDAYFRGLQGWNQRSRDGFLQAISEFTRATQLDPNYAPAFAGLARVYSLSPIFAGLPVDEAVPKALDAAARSLALDETLADAHSAIGFIKGHYQHDWATAEKELKGAIELEPNNPYSHFFYSNSFLSPFGHHDEAIVEIRQAMALDPLSTRIQSFAGRTLTWARHYDEAVAQYQRVNQLDPNFPLNHERLSLLYAFLGKYDDSIAEETKARLLYGQAPEVVLAKMKGLQQAFENGQARGYWKEQLRLSTDKKDRTGLYSAPYNLAIVYVHLEQKENALTSLESAYAQRDEQMSEMAVEPDFDPLRSEARFTEIERRIGLVH